MIKMSDTSNSFEEEENYESIEESFTDWCKRHIDLDNFPDPDTFLPLNVMNITCENPHGISD